MKVVLETGAVGDLDVISDFYEKQEAGVGAYFIQQFALTARALQWNGGSHRQRGGYHFCLVERFPVGIYYRVEEGEVRISGVLDCRRHPNWITHQLKKR